MSKIIPNKKRRRYYAMIECKNCKRTNTTKNGIVRAKQRYKCKDCGYNFVIGHAHSSSKKLAKKALVVMLYSLGRTSYSKLAKIFGVTNGTIHNWVTEAANGLPPPAISDDTTEIEFDEMWHYIGQKNESCGSSRQLPAELVEQLHGYLADAMKRHSADSMTK
jgi:transposase-like protein